jgi:hypothetical protein
MEFESLLRSSDLWMDGLNLVDVRDPGFANAVDNLGPKSPPVFSRFQPARLPFIHVAGERRFNRSPPSLELRVLVPVEKSGPDFHRLAVPTCPKSPIRSIPKYGSGVVRLAYC